LKGSFPEKKVLQLSTYKKEPPYRELGGGYTNFEIKREGDAEASGKQSSSEPLP